MIRDAQAPADAGSKDVPMNKIAIAAAALLAIVLLALPGVVGSITEANVRDRVAAIDARAGTKAEVTSYERGWFRSTARITVGAENDVNRFPAPGAELAAFGDLPIVVELAHGPVAILDGAYFGWAKVVARPDGDEQNVAELTQTLGVPYLFEFRGRTPYVGGLTFDADAPPFAAPLDAGAEMTFSGGTVVGKLAGQRLEADAQIGSFDFAFDGGSIAMRGLLASADNELRSDYVMPGEASLSIASITVAAAQGATPMFETTNLRIKSDVHIDSAGELLEMRVTYDVDTVRMEESQLTAGSVGFTVEHLDVAALEAYGALVSEAAAAGDPQILTASLGPHVERALQRGPSMLLDPIRFRYDDEPFTGRVEITTDPARLPPAGTLSLDDPMLMLSVVDAKADLSLSKTLAGQLAALGARMQLGSDPTIPPEQLEYMAEAQSGLVLAMLVGQGVLIEEGDGYKASFDYTDGSMTLNGNPLPFGLQ
jgi:uncharacterized protein YdgA (DUF945 family)